MRQSVSRLEKSGYEVRVLTAGDADERLRAELKAVSEEWRGNWPERGFTMAMDAMFIYPDSVLAVAIGPDGSIGGFLQLVPSPASDGYSLASMRRRRDTPNGLMEYLITETVVWARQHAVTELSLNFAVFADFLRTDETATRWTRAMRWGLLKADRLFQVERLHSFNRKFFPHWRRRYFCFERWTDFPLAGSRVPARGVAADAARPLGQVVQRPGRAMRRLWPLALVALAAVLVGGASARTQGLHLVRVAHFSAPVYATSAPGEPGNLYVVEQAGRILVLTNGHIRSAPFLDIRSQVRSGGEQGLLSVAFAPDYAQSHRFYVDYTDSNGDTRVVQYRSNGTSAIASSAKQLLFVKDFASNHNGGQLQFGPGQAPLLG